MHRLRTKPWLDPWRRSPQFREISLRALRHAQALNRSRPRCGATRRTDGQPCRNPAILNGNGRCRYHGGRVPKGRQWHVQQLPGTDPSFERKLRDLERRRQKQAARVAAMTPEERARYEAWHRSHRPGPASDRAHGRVARDAAEFLSNLLAEPRPRPAEMAEIDAMIRELEADLAIASGEGFFG